MKNTLYYLLILILGTFVACSKQDKGLLKKDPAPSDYLFLQRAFPYETVPSQKYYEAMAWANGQASLRNDIEWELVGPQNVGGRITDIAMHASDDQTIYAASASGGVWKSVDQGANWFPISDQLPSLSIGDIALDPGNASILYCGTGETNGGGGSVTYDGAGVFKSVDGGSSWTSVGLENTGSIGRIEVDPENSDKVYVAAMGHLFGNNADRGIFRSEDGGQTWSNQLFVNDSTGAIDILIHPQDPDTLYAVSWERLRRPSYRKYGGPGSGIYRSVDGGDSWTKLQGGLPTGSNVGRIGLAISPSSPNILYATVADQIGYFVGTYKSLDNGETWTELPGSPDPGFSSYGWWFGQIRVHPANPDIVYNLGVGWIKTSNGGTSWSNAAGGLHADHHALYIHPANNNLVVEGNDGGIYISTNGGNSFTFRPFPVLQFYTSEIDFQNPDILYGGLQDNGTWRSTVQDPFTWDHIYGGDGFVCLVNPNNGTWYAEYQYGNMGGSNGASSPNSSRSNWNSPYVFDPQNPSIMYFGKDRLFKSTNSGFSWTPISQDLSNGNSGAAGVVYGTITSIAVSPANSQVIWAGTDDGNVWVSANGGSSWDKVSDNLPQRWVTRVTADYTEAGTAYLCLSGFKNGDNMAHIYKTTDYGLNWVPVDGNLPDIPVNDLIIDPLAAGNLVIATDIGVFNSADDGATWSVLGTGLPNVPYLDLTFHAPTRKLVAASYGRSMFSTSLPFVSNTAIATHDQEMNISPNPCTDRVTIQWNEVVKKDQQLRVWSADGKLIQSIPVFAGTNRLEMLTIDWAKGNYFLRFGNQSQTIIKN